MVERKYLIESRVRRVKLLGVVLIFEMQSFSILKILNNKGYTDTILFVKCPFTDFSIY